MAFKSLSSIQFICIPVPLLWSIPFCQLSASFRWLVFGSWGINKLTGSSAAYPLTGNFHPFVWPIIPPIHPAEPFTFIWVGLGLTQSLGFVWRPYVKHGSLCMPRYWKQLLPSLYFLISFLPIFKFSLVFKVVLLQHLADEFVTALPRSKFAFKWAL